MKIKMGICVKCEEEFPDEILSPMIGGGGPEGLMCGVCALKERNEFHGLPEDTPFQGEIAQQFYEQALAIKERRKNAGSISSKKHKGR